MIAAVCRTMTIANTAGTLILQSCFLLGGIVLPKGQNHIQNLIESLKNLSNGSKLTQSLFLMCMASFILFSYHSKTFL